MTTDVAASQQTCFRPLRSSSSATQWSSIGKLAFRRRRVLTLLQFSSALTSSVGSSSASPTDSTSGSPGVDSSGSGKRSSSSGEAVGSTSVSGMSSGSNSTFDSGSSSFGTSSSSTASRSYGGRRRRRRRRHEKQLKRQLKQCLMSDAVVDASGRAYVDKNRGDAYIELKAAEDGYDEIVGKCG